MDNKIIQVALDGLENILKVGEIDKEAAGAGGINQYAQFVEEAGGMVSIHNLQHHENLEIYKKCFYIMDSESFLADDMWDGELTRKNSSQMMMRRRQRMPHQQSMHQVNTLSSLMVSYLYYLEKQADE